MPVQPVHIDECHHAAEETGLWLKAGPQRVGGCTPAVGGGRSSQCLPSGRQLDSFALGKHRPGQAYIHGGHGHQLNSAALLPTIATSAVAVVSPMPMSCISCFAAVLFLARDNMVMGLPLPDELMRVRTSHDGTVLRRLASRITRGGEGPSIR
jgi:hypothetical protein